MSRLLRPAAREVTADAWRLSQEEPWRAAGVLRLLGLELSAPRRLGAAVGGLVVAALGALVCGFALELELPASLALWLPGALVVAAGALLGWAALAAGAAVVRAYVVWSRADRAAPHPAVAFSQGFTLRALWRSALTAASFLAAAFAWAGLYTAAAPSDPADLGTPVLVLIPFYLVVGTGMSVAFVALLVGDLRVGHARTSSATRRHH